MKTLSQFREKGLGGGVGERLCSVSEMQGLGVREEGRGIEKEDEEGG